MVLWVYGPADAGHLVNEWPQSVKGYCTIGVVQGL
jgi:hypothetical protein